MREAKPRLSAVLAALAAGAAALLHLAAAARLPLGSADEGLHLLLARNLAAGGYAVPDAAGIPLAAPLPGLALLLAVPARVLGPEWLMLRGLVLLSTAALVLFAWRLGRRLGGEAGAWAAGLLAASSPAVAAWTGLAVPDVPFAAAAAAALLLLSGGEPAWPSVAAAGALAALLRPEGAVLAAALAAGVGFRAGPRRAAAVLAGALAPLGLWLLRGRLLLGAPAAYLEPWRPIGSAAGLAVRAVMLAAGAARGLFGGIPAVLALAGLAVAAWAAAAGARRLWREGPGPRALVMAAVLFAAGAAALRAAGGAWQGRYALAFLPPLIPLWSAAFASAWERRRGAALAALLLLAAPGLARLAQCARAGLGTRGLEPWPRAAAWLRARASADDAVVARDAALAALVTGLRAYPPSPAPTREAWLEDLRARGERFVLVTPPDADRRPSSFDDWAVPSPPLSLAYSDDAEGVEILRLD